MKKSTDIKIFNIIGYSILLIIALICLIPFLLVLMGSLTEEKEIIMNGYSLFPSKYL